MPERKHISLRKQLNVALRQLGFDPTECELDHFPALALRKVNSDGTDWIPAQDDERYLVWRPRAEHRVKTSGTKATSAGSDIHAIAKAKRVSREQEEFRRAMLAKSGQGEVTEKSSKWPKRSFQSNKRNEP
jgi:hypothetical protein